MGRYGEEIGSDQFGATIMASGSEMSRNGTQPTILRISNIEVNNNNHLYLFIIPMIFLFPDKLRWSSISSRPISSTFSYEW